MTSLRHFLTVGAAFAAAATSSAALADALVVRSTGPSATSYPVGRRLTPADRIVLRAGDRVVLVGEGATRTLAGPGNFPVRAANSANLDRGATLGRYLSANGSSISRTGAVRGSGSTDRPMPSNLWLVDIERGGTVCVLDTANITLWRPYVSEDTLLTVQSVDAPQSTSALAFVVGQNFRLWPHDSMPVAEGRSYRISGPGLAQPTVINFVTVPNAPMDATGVANVLAEKGCMGQLAQLGERLAEASATP